MTDDRIKEYCPICGKPVLPVIMGALEIKPKRGKKFLVHPDCYKALPKYYPL